MASKGIPTPKVAREQGSVRALALHLKNMQPNKKMFCFFDPHNLAKTGVWQKMVITMKSGMKNCVEIHDPMPKSSSDDPKTAIFLYFLSFSWPRPGKGINPKALYLRPLPFSRYWYVAQWEDFFLRKTRIFSISKKMIFMCKNYNAHFRYRLWILSSQENTKTNTFFIFWRCI